MTTTQEANHPVVYIVDDDKLVRRALKRLFDVANQHARTFSSARKFLDHFPQGGLGCLVLDVYMPGMSGIELLNIMNERAIDLPVIMLTGRGDIKTAVGAIKAGAVDFVEKPVDDHALVELVRAAIIDRAARQSELGQTNEIREDIAQLTPREREVLQLIVAGELSKRIAHQLSVSEKTIEFHRAKIMKKLHAKSLADLVRKSTIGGLY